REPLVGLRRLSSRKPPDVVGESGRRCEPSNMGLARCRPWNFPDPTHASNHRAPAREGPETGLPTRGGRADGPAHAPHGGLVRWGLNPATTSVTPVCMSAGLIPYTSTRIIPTAA